MSHEKVGRQGFMMKKLRNRNPFTCFPEIFLAISEKKRKFAAVIRGAPSFGGAEITP